MILAIGGASDGQLGVGVRDRDVLQPHALALPASDDGVMMVSSSLRHLLACTASGVCLSAGSNSDEQLGREPRRATQLRPVASLSTHVIRQVAAGDRFSLALSDSGRLFSWGANAYGQLGVGDAKPRPRPRPVRFDSSALRICQVAAGNRHALCLSESGAAYAWGCSHSGQIGHATCVSSLRPVLLEALSGCAPASIAVGGDHSVVRTAAGRLYSWGSNVHGQLCLGDEERIHFRCELVRCAGAVTAVDVACGKHHTAVVSSTGAVLTAGSNARGQLGREASEPRDRKRLQAVQMRHHGRALGVACGDYHTLVLVRDEESGRTKVISFGLSASGQLGHKAREAAARDGARRTFVRVPRAVHLPDATARGERATALWAGGNGSWFAMSSAEDASAAAMTKEASEAASSHFMTLRSLKALLTKLAALAVAADAPLGASGELRLSDAARERRAARLVEQKSSALAAARLAIDRCFSSVSILNASFCASSCADEHAPLSRSRLRVCDVSSAYALILESGKEHAKLLTTLRAASCRVAADLERLSSARRMQRGGLESGAGSQDRPESLHAILIVLLSPQLRRGRIGSASSSITRNAISAFLRLPAACRDLFRTWWSELSEESFSAVVSSLVAFINFSQSSGAVADIWGAATVLKELWTISETVRSQNVSHLSFVCDELTFSDEEVKQDYTTWRTQRHTVHSFSAFAFLLNADIKRRIFRAEATSRMALTQQRSVTDFFTAIAAAALPTTASVPTLLASDFALRIVVRRQHLLRDALDALAPIYQSRREELLRPLVVQFDGEPGEDLGGVTKEFFTLLLRALTRGSESETKAEEGAGEEGAGEEGAAKRLRSEEIEPLFEITEGGFLWWCSGKGELEWTGERLRHHELVGVLFSLAVYNGALLGVGAPFSRFFLQQMLPEGGGVGVAAARPTLDELRRIKPSVAAGLDALLDYNESDDGVSIEDAFQLEYDEGGIEFNTVAVNAGNRNDYVRVFVHDCLEGSVRSRFAAFRTGFVCIGSAALKLFSAHDIGLLLSGLELRGGLELLEQRSTNYVGFTKDSIAIKTFWKAVALLDHAQQQLLLQFWTGSLRVPILGIETLRVRIQKHGSFEHLPQAHTCFNTLLLPDYGEDLEHVCERLRVAITHSEGFFLR
jgi:alpha-tubulin suppressor-like RCC1 family protein